MTAPISPFRVVMIGIVWVNLPVLAIMFGGWIGIPALAISFFPKVAPMGEAGAIVLVAAWILIPWVSAWLWWSFNIPKWRIWAMENTGDWRAVQRMAILWGLIWDERTALGRLMAKTEIWTVKDRERESQLKNRQSAQRNIHP
jgi:hypothetical protein